MRRGHLGPLGRRYPMSPVLAGLIAGAAIAGIVALMGMINVDYGAPWQITHTLTADVSDANGMAPGNDVRIAGRVAGQITSVRSRGTYSAITFKVDGNDWPLPDDTTAQVRLANLLGLDYLSLVPGHAPTDLPDGGVIPLQSTQPVINFDQIVDTFNAPTMQHLTSLIRTGGAALAGQEGTLQQILPTWAALDQESQVSTGVLSKDNANVDSILRNLATTAQTLDQSRLDLAGVIDNLNSVNATLASHQAALEGFISNGDALNRTGAAVLGGGSAHQFNAGLTELGSFTTQLNQLLATLIPQTRSYHTSNADTAGLDLIYEIGDATSQSDPAGYFLRENGQGADICGLTPACGASPPSASGSAPSLPSLLPSALPPLPSLPLPTPPSSLCKPVPVPGCPTPTPSSSPSSLPSLPLPTPGLTAALPAALTAPGETLSASALTSLAAQLGAGLQELLQW